LQTDATERDGSGGPRLIAPCGLCVVGIVRREMKICYVKIIPKFRFLLHLSSYCRCCWCEAIGWGRLVGAQLVDEWNEKTGYRGQGRGWKLRSRAPLCAPLEPRERVAREGLRETKKQNCFEFHAFYVTFVLTLRKMTVSASHAPPPHPRQKAPRR